MQDEQVTKAQELVYEMSVDQVMTKDVITVPPRMPMSELGEIFRRERISGTPVVDGGRLVGIISLQDFIKWTSDRDEGATPGEGTHLEVSILTGEKHEAGRDN